jgi:hypothetical protein
MESPQHRRERDVFYDAQVRKGLAMCVRRVILGPNGTPHHTDPARTASEAHAGADMRKLLVMILMVLLAVPAFCQSSSTKYQPGTIIAVKPHPGDSGTNSSVTRYDVSIKIGNILYTVLYSPPPGSYGSKYAAGRELLVLVGDKTLTFNDTLGDSRKVPIISRTPVPPPSN